MASAQEDPASKLIAGIEYERDKGYGNVKGKSQVFNDFFGTTLASLHDVGIPPQTAERFAELQAAAGRYGTLGVAERKAVLSQADALLEDYRKQQEQQAQQAQRQRAAEQQQIKQQAERKSAAAQQQQQQQQIRQQQQAAQQQEQQIRQQADVAASQPPPAAGNDAAAGAWEHTSLASQTLEQQLATPFAPVQHLRLVPILFDLETSGKYQQCCGGCTASYYCR